jgi:hypothetical protein
MPNMIGDPSLGSFFAESPEQGQQAISPMSIPGSWRYKVTDDNNTLPVDRMFFDYEHFNGGIAAHGPADLNHFLFGAEKTFFDRMASLEVRLPIEQGIAADQPAAPLLVASGTQIGNVGLIPKVVLYSHGDWNIAAGLGIILPTAPYATLATFTYQNRSTHLQPFIGADWQGDRCFAMFIAGLDFDTAGNPVVQGGTELGRVFDENLLYFDGKVGFWLYRDTSARILKAIAPALELHYTSTISDGVGVFAFNGGFPVFVGPQAAGLGRWDNLDITAGVHVFLRKSILTIFAAAPLHNQLGPAPGVQSDSFAEVGVQADRRF